MKTDVTLLIDMDSTAYDITTPWLSWANEKFGDDFTQDQMLTWDWSDSHKGKSGVYSFLHLPNVFLDLKPYPGVVEAMRVAKAMGVTQVFATTCTTKQGAWEKMQAIERDFPFIGRDNVLVTGGAKQYFSGDILIDDGPHNLEAFKAHNKNSLTCAFDMPYNRETRTDFRMTDWSQYLDMVQDIIEWKRSNTE